MAVDDIAERTPGVMRALGHVAPAVMVEVLVAGSIEAKLVPGVKHCAQPPDTLARHIDVNIDAEAGDALAHASTLQANFPCIHAKAGGGHCLGQFVTRNDGERAVGELFAQGKASRELCIVRRKSDVVGVARIRNVLGACEAKQRAIERYGYEVR